MNLDVAARKRVRRAGPELVATPSLEQFERLAVLVEPHHRAVSLALRPGIANQDEDRIRVIRGLGDRPRHPRLVPGDHEAADRSFPELAVPGRGDAPRPGALRSSLDEMRADAAALRDGLAVHEAAIDRLPSKVGASRRRRRGGRVTGW